MQMTEFLPAVYLDSMKHIVITGATRGLGRALALGFAAEGWAVSGCGTRPTSIANMEKEMGDKHLLRKCDVTDSGEVKRFADAAMEAHGPPDLLLNNAGIVNTNAPLWEVPEKEFSRVIDVNLKGVHIVLAAFLPAMIARGSGIIVNFSSGWGRSTSPEVGPYCASKWGIEGLTSALAQELPRGLAATALNPGIINTEMLRTSFGSDAASYPDPLTWAKSAIPFLCNLTPACNGKRLAIS